MTKQYVKVRIHDSQRTYTYHNDEEHVIAEGDRVQVTSPHGATLTGDVVDAEDATEHNTPRFNTKPCFKV